jgi:cation:H+ antiporter
VRWLAPLILGAVGVALLIGGVGRLLKTVRRRAVVAGVSALTLGLLTTSVDLESTAAGVASAAKGLGTVAAGISVGSVTFLATGALGLACLLFPFSVKIPRYFLGVFVVSAVAASAVLLGGGVNRLDSLGLLMLFVVMVAGGLRHLRIAPDEKTPQPPRNSGVASLAKTRLAFVATIGASLVATTVGAQFLASAAQRAIATTHLSETLLGTVIVAIALSLEEGLIEVLPAWRGTPEIAVGNVLGTTAFLLTGSLGIVALAFPIHLEPGWTTLQVPALLGAVALATWALTRPRTGRREGVALIAYYVLYLAASWFTGVALHGS